VEINSFRKVTALLALTAGAMLSACTQDKSAPTISVATGAVGGNYQMIGHAIARASNTGGKPTTRRVTDEISAGSVDNINSVLAGTATFGIAQADHQYQALQGLANWSDRGPQSKLRSVLALYPEAVTLIAGADSGIETVADLRGKKVDIGQPGSGTRQNAIDALSAAGLDWQQDIQASANDPEERLAALMHSRLDAFFYTVGHPNTDIKFATYSVRGARFIPLTDIESLVASNPFYSPTTIPAELYERAYDAAATPTVGVKATLVTSADVDDQTVYELTRAVFENLEAIAAYRPVMADITRERMLEGLTAPIHNGAMRYYKEVGLDIPMTPQ
jgi:TRAP transporter TAXI family solute receptor